MKQPIFFISDGTGITAETLGYSLLTQFNHVDFDLHSIPYVNTPKVAQEIVAQINHVATQSQIKPIVFATLLEENIQSVIATCDAVVLDFFASFLPILEATLHTRSTHKVGRAHGLDDYKNYMLRIDAVNYALASDDGAGEKSYDKADIILIGVSRCGKTPTCVYMAMQFGVFAANYPFIEDDLQRHELPSMLQRHRNKLFGLTITAERLHEVRQERRPDSHYAAQDQCAHEIQTIEKLYQAERIPFLDTTHLSIEEISTQILALTQLKRRLLK